MTKSEHTRLVLEAFEAYRRALDWHKQASAELANAADALQSAQGRINQLTTVEVQE